MSADNWASCPKCLANHQKAVAQRQKNAEESYGKIPAKEYLKLLKGAEDKKKPSVDTLREDYYIGVNEQGVFRVSYLGSCSECDFSFSYEHEEEASLEDGKQTKKK